MNTKEKSEVDSEPELKCEWIAISPSGGKHCVHDDHINWKDPNGCTAEFCPIAKNIFK